ncbi:MAG: insulinase family protein [Armatimonadetes bacterium]|nr:insulinase family protein [Armatimonadota bacterium]
MPDRSSIAALTLRAVWVLALSLAAALPVHAQTRDVSKLIFPNGFRLLAKPEPGKGLIALDMVIRAGAQEETDQPGMGQVVARTLFTGARNLSARKLAQLSDEVGGSFAVTWDPDYTEIYIATTKDQLSAAVELLAETLISPKINASAVEAAKTMLRSDMERAGNDAFRSAYDEMRRLLYRDSPYRRPLLGEQSAVDKISAADVQQFIGKWFVPGNMVLAVVGDVSVQQTQDAVKLWFGKQQSAAAPRREPIATESGPQRPPSLLEVDSNSSYLVAGTLASGMASANYAADMAAITVLGGGKASRMFQDLREQRGLAYELGTLYPPLLNQSHALAYVVGATYTLQPDARGQKPTTETIRSALRGAVVGLREKPITQEELNRAKSYLIGTFALAHERLRERAKHLAWYEAMGLGFGYDDLYPQKIQAVTLAQVRDSADRLFDRSAMVVVVPKE